MIELIIPSPIIQMGAGSVFILAPGDNQALLSDSAIIPAPPERRCSA